MNHLPQDGVHVLHEIFKPMDVEWAYKKEKNHILENLFMWQKMTNLILLNQAITEQCMHIYITCLYVWPYFYAKLRILCSL